MAGLMKLSKIIASVHRAQQKYQRFIKRSFPFLLHKKKKKGKLIENRKQLFLIFVKLSQLYKILHNCQNFTSSLIHVSRSTNIKIKLELKKSKWKVYEEIRNIKRNINFCLYVDLNFQILHRRKFIKLLRKITILIISTILESLMLNETKFYEINQFTLFLTTVFRVHRTINKIQIIISPVID